MLCEVEAVCIPPPLPCVSRAQRRTDPPPLPVIMMWYRVEWGGPAGPHSPTSPGQQRLSGNWEARWGESDLCLPFPAECTSLLKGKKTVWIGALLSDVIRAEKEVALAPTDLQWGSMGRLLHFCQDGVGRPEQETENTHSLGLVLCLNRETAC